MRNATQKKGQFGALVEKSCKDAIGAVKILRKVSNDAESDLSVHEFDASRLSCALDALESALNDVFGSETRSKACLGLFEERATTAEQHPNVEGTAEKINDTDSAESENKEPVRE